jgi:hypothetical protein
MSDLSDDDLLDALGVEAAPIKAGSRTPREERIIAGFEDILRFYETHGRAPQHGEAQDIFERLYAVRLDRLRALPEANDLLKAIDTPGLLNATAHALHAPVEHLDDEALLAELGVGGGEGAAADITVLRNVSSHEERRAAEEMAHRTACKDFEQFKPLFEQGERELKDGARQSRLFGKDASVATGDFFVLGGQVVYVAETGETIRATNGETDARLRVIYSNGTESNLLRRSLQRALYKDETGRRLVLLDAGPLFGETMEAGDVESGTIYVLRSLSSHPYVAAHRELVHKIGVTGGKVETRIANAALEATYLLADVEIVATYKLAGINRTKLENLFHRIFAPAQIDLIIQDRFGRPVRPREWFLVPLHVIDEAVKHVVEGSIAGMSYDPTAARLV